MFPLYLVAYQVQLMVRVDQSKMRYFSIIPGDENYKNLVQYDQETEPFTEGQNLPVKPV